jgi:hypothetical protein
MSRLRWLAVSVGALWCSAALAQDMMIYPAKGQTPEQQQRDKGECHVWAVNETGFDPATAQAPPPTIMVQGAPQQPVTGSGARVRGAARGAAVGGVVGAIGDDAGEGAAKGAAAGAMIGGMRRRQENRAAAQPTEQPNPAYQDYIAKRDGYTRGVKACLSARGYTVQ